METHPALRPFRVDVSEEDLDDLRRRIEAASWPTKELVEDRSQGVQLATMQELARYWQTDYGRSVPAAIPERKAKRWRALRSCRRSRTSRRRGRDFWPGKGPTTRVWATTGDSRK
jgi:hypothetical protein